MTVEVCDIQILTPTVKRFQFRPVAAALPRVTPGAHVTTRITTGNQTYTRNYSICSEPNQHVTYEIAIRRQPDPNSATVLWHTCVEVGTTFEISLPKNHFPLSPSANKHLLIAGGIGITPMLPMMTALSAAGIPFELHYAAPDKQHCAFYADIERRFGSQASFYFSRSGQRLTTDILAKQRIGTHAYLCGPLPMQRAFYDAAIAVGYPMMNVHFERFQRLRQDNDSAFEVMLARQRRTIEVGAADTLLETLTRNGVEVPSSCRAGGCGTCIVPVLQGDIDHRDFFLDEDEKEAQREIVSCVSRACGRRLVLDL